MKTPFSKLTKQQKRITILKDALKWVKSDVLKANTGTVIESPIIYEAEGSAQSAFLAMMKNKKPCEVCARGALLVSTVIHTNKFDVDQLLDDNGYFDAKCEVDKKITSVFPESTVRLMEEYFEGQSDAGSDFVELYPNDKQRLIKILKNAIKNKGIFKPS
jgi:hypothetical protein